MSFKTPRKADWVWMPVMGEERQWWSLSKFSSDCFAFVSEGEKSWAESGNGHVSGLKKYVRKSHLRAWARNELEQWFSKGDPQASSIYITWKLVRNANSQDLFQTHFQTFFYGWTWQIFQRFWRMLTFQSHCMIFESPYLPWMSRTCKVRPVSYCIVGFSPAKIRFFSSWNR